MALFAQAILLRAELISTGANSAPPAPAALSTAAVETATDAVAGVFMLLQPAAISTLDPSTSIQRSPEVLVMAYSFRRRRGGRRYHDHRRGVCRLALVSLGPVVALAAGGPGRAVVALIAFRA